MNFVVYKNGLIEKDFYDEIFNQFNKKDTLITNKKESILEFFPNENKTVVFIEISFFEDIDIIAQIRDRGGVKSKNNCYIIAVLSKNSEDIKSVVLKQEVEELVVAPVDRNILLEKLKRIEYKLKHIECNHPQKFSLFFGRYDSFHAHFTIKCESDLLSFIKFAETYQANPVHIVKFINALKKANKTIKLICEKSTNYLCITTNLDLREDLKSVKNLHFINQTKVFTYRLEILFKETIDKILSESKIKQEINSLKHSYKLIEESIQLDNYDDEHIYKILDKIKLDNYNIDDLYELSNEIESSINFSEELDEDLKNKILSFLTVYLKIFSNFSNTRLVVDEIYYVIRRISKSKIPKERHKLVLQSFYILQNNLFQWINNFYIKNDYEILEKLNNVILENLLEIKKLIDN